MTQPRIQLEPERVKSGERIRTVPQMWHQIFYYVVTMYTEAVQVTIANASAVYTRAEEHLHRAPKAVGWNPAPVQGAIINASA